MCVCVCGCVCVCVNACVCVCVCAHLEDRAANDGQRLIPAGLLPLAGPLRAGYRCNGSKHAPLACNGSKHTPLADPLVDPLADQLGVRHPALELGLAGVACRRTVHLPQGLYEALGQLGQDEPASG